MQETQETLVRSQSQEYPLEEEMAILAWKIPRREKSGGLKSMEAIKCQMQLSTYKFTIKACIRISITILSANPDDAIIVWKLPKKVCSHRRRHKKLRNHLQ